MFVNGSSLERDFREQASVKLMWTPSGNDLQAEPNHLVLLVERGTSLPMEISDKVAEASSSSTSNVAASGDCASTTTIGDQDGGDNSTDSQTSTAVDGDQSLDFEIPTPPPTATVDSGDEHELSDNDTDTAPSSTASQTVHDVQVTTTHHYLGNHTTTSLS